MEPNWLIYYRSLKGESDQFAEVMLRENGSTIRRGGIFTHGVVSAFDESKTDLDGYELARRWVFDPEEPDYAQLEEEISEACSRERGESNALALVTDSSLMTIGLALHRFDDIEAADDEELWVVDEWDTWLEDGGLDPAFRWLLAYEFFNELEVPSFETFQENVVAVMQRCLMKLPVSVRIRLIYVGGDDIGHRWSADCMEKQLSDRMLAWI